MTDLTEDDGTALGQTMMEAVSKLRENGIEPGVIKVSFQSYLQLQRPRSWTNEPEPQRGGCLELFFLGIPVYADPEVRPGEILILPKESK